MVESGQPTVGEELKQIYLGYSEDRNGVQIRDWLDVDPSHPDGASVFEREFGAGHLYDGAFEVYDIKEFEAYGEAFTLDLLKTLLLFNLPDGYFLKRCREKVPGT